MLVSIARLTSLFVLALLLTSAASCTTAGELGRPAPRGPAAATAAECSVEEVFARRVTIDDGSELYIEAVALAASGEDVLLAGFPSYRHFWDAPGTPRRLSTDSILGAVIGPDGRARAVPSPIPSRLVSEVRALGRPDGSWDVVVPELIPFPEGTWPRTDTIARLWHGVFDGTRWRSLQEIPVAPGTMLISEGASGLVRAGDTLAWAVRSAPAYHRTVVVFQHTPESGWSSETIPTGWTGMLALAHTPESGLLLAAPRTDPSGHGGSMSLFLFSRNGQWGTPRLLDAGENPVHDPVLAISRGTTLLAWTAEAGSGRVVRAVTDPLNAATGEFRVIDTEYRAMRAVRLVSSPDAFHWLLPSSPDNSTTPTIRILRGDAEAIREIGRIPNPYLTGGFSATSVGKSDVIVAGPVLRDQVPVSVVTRRRVACAPARAPAG